MPPSPSAPLPPEEPIQWILVFRPHLDELLAAADATVRVLDSGQPISVALVLRLQAAADALRPPPEPATPDIVTPEGWKP